MTYREFLVLRASELENGESPLLDASLILAHCMGMKRDRLLALFPEEAASPPPSFEECWARRKAGESVAYIVGRKEFFGREFLVDGRVLVPRPDTETLVMAALEVGDGVRNAQAAIAADGRPGRAGKGPGGLRLHDVCTGSGAVALSVAAERRDWAVSASDLSPGALDLARENSRRLLGREIPFICADLLQGLDGSFDIITANPPYVTTRETAELLARGWKEPSLALDGGADGLDLVRRLVGQAKKALFPWGFLLVETDALQSETVRGMFMKEGFCEVRTWKDLAGLERITGARRP